MAHGFFEYLTQHPEAGRWFDRGLANFAAADWNDQQSVQILRTCREAMGDQDGFW
jgi:hypothetical protein